MSKSYDDRIVRMGFDNTKFESNAAKTMSTLDKLNEKLKLKGSSEGSENVQRSIDSVNFASMERAIMNIERRFSTLGVVGMNVIGQITNGITNSVKQLEAATIGQIKSGGWSRAMNIANAKFQIEGLGFAWEEVEKAVSYGVKDTAYGLDAAASAASQLAASGVDFKKTLDTVNGQDLTAMHKSLRAISGVAAMTNSSYEDIARIFTTVAGNGRLMGDQLLQLSSRGMNAAAKLAETLGTTEGEIREMVSRGKIDFQTFAFAMDDAFGAHAKEANKTFTGALGNMKAALSRVGEIFASPIINKTNTLFISLTERIDEFKNKLKSIKVPRTLDEIKKQYDGITLSATAYEQILKGMDGNTITFGDHFAEMWQSGIDAFSAMIKSIDISWFDKIVEKVDNVTVKIKDFFDLIKEIYGESAEEAAESINDATQTLVVSAEEAQAAKDIILKGMYGNGQQRVDALTELFGGGDEGAKHAKNVQAYIDSVIAADYDYEKASIKVADANEKVAESQVDIARETKKARIKYIIDGITTTFNNLWTTAKNIGTSAGKVFDSIFKAFSSVFEIDLGGITKSTSSLSDKLVKLSEKLIISDETASKITVVFTKFFGVIQKGIGYLKKGAESAGKFAKSIAESKAFSTITDLISSLFDKISGFSEFKVDENNPVITFLTTIVNAIDEFVTSNDSAPSKLTTFVNDIIDAVMSVKWGDVAKLGGMAFAVYNIVKLVLAIKALGNIVMGIANIPAAISGFFTKIGTAVESASDAYAIVSAAKSLAIVAGAIVVLSQIPDENLYKAIGTIIIITLVIRYLMKSANELGSAQTSFKGIASAASSALSVVKTMYAVAALIAALAAAVTIMSVGLAIIEKSGATNGPSFLILIGLLSAITVVSYAMVKMVSSINMKSMMKLPVVLSSMSLMFVALGGTVLMMSAALSILSKIPSKSFGVVFTLLATMFGGMALMIKMSTDAKPSRLLAASVTIAAIGSAMSVAMTAIGGAVFVISSAMTMLKASGTDATIGLLTIVGIISGLVLAMVAITEIADNVKNAAKTVLIMMTMSSVILAISGAAILISTALRIIGGIPADSMSTAITALVTILGGMIVLMHVSSELKPTQMLSSAVMFISISTSVLILAAAIGVLSRLGSDNTLSAAGSIFTVLVGLGVAMALASSSLGKAQNSAGAVVGGILAMSVAIGIIALAIAKIGNVKRLAASALSLVGVIVAIGAVLAVMSVISGNGESSDSMFALGAAFIMIAGSMLILAFAMEKVASIGEGIKTAAIAFGIFAGVVIVLAAVAAFFPAFGVALETVGKAFIYVGAAALLIGAGIYLVAAAIKAIAPMLPILAVGMLSVFTVLEDHWLTALLVGAGIIAVLVLAAVVISKLSPVIEAIGTTISSVAKSIGNVLSAGTSKLSKWISNLSVRGKATIVALITTLCAAIMKASPQMLNTVGQLIIKLLAYLGKIAGDVALGLLDFIINLINGLADAIRMNSARIAAALWGVVISLLDVFMQIIGQFLYMLISPISKGFAEEVRDTVSKQSEALNEYALDMRKAAEEADQAKRDYNQAIMDSAGETEAAVDRSKSAFSGLTDIIGTESEKQSTSLSSLKEQYEDLPGYAYDAILRSKNPELFRQDGADSASAWGNGFDDVMHGGGGDSWDTIDVEGYGVENAEIAGTESGTTYTTAEANAIIDGSDEIYSATDENVDGAHQAIIDNEDETKKAVQEHFNDPFQLQIRSGRANTYAAAEYVVDGMIQAFNDKQDSYASAAVRLAKAGNEAYEKENRIESPSKRYYQYAAYMVQGFVNGIDKNSDNAAGAMENLSDAVINSFGNPLDYLTKITTGELEYDPRIRPVFDSSGIYKGVSSINTMLNQQTISVSGLSGKLAADIGTLDKGNADVVTELRGLREDMFEMQDAIENMRIVMDTGALVGATVGAYDRALGRKQLYKERGN